MTPRPVTEHPTRPAKHDVRILDLLLRKDRGEGVPLEEIHFYLGGEHRHELFTDGVNYPIKHADTLASLRKRKLVARVGQNWRLTPAGQTALRNVGTKR